MSAAMNDSLQDFAAGIEAKSRITFGDVRRLQRDHLPGGLSNFEEARILLQLDANVTRRDRAWLQWLVATIVDFAVPSDGTRATDDTLEALLALENASARARRRIAREIREARRRQSGSTLAPALEEINELDERMLGDSSVCAESGALVESLAEAAIPDVVDSGATALQLAA
jgi:hypothetical protein